MAYEQQAANLHFNNNVLLSGTFHNCALSGFLDGGYTAAITSIRSIDIGTDESSDVWLTYENASATIRTGYDQVDSAYLIEDTSAGTKPVTIAAGCDKVIHTHPNNVVGIGLDSDVSYRLKLNSGNVLVSGNIICYDGSQDEHAITLAQHNSHSERHEYDGGDPMHTQNLRGNTFRIDIQRDSTLSNNTSLGLNLAGELTNVNKLGGFPNQAFVLSGVSINCFHNDSTSPPSTWDFTVRDVSASTLGTFTFDWDANTLTERLSIGALDPPVTITSGMHFDFAAGGGGIGSPNIRVTIFGYFEDS